MVWVHDGTNEGGLWVGEFRYIKESYFKLSNASAKN